MRHAIRQTSRQALIFLFIISAACGDQKVQLKESKTSTPTPPPAMVLLERLKQDTVNRPDDPAAWSALGNYWFDHHKPDLAIPAYRKALELDPDNGNVRTDLGTMYRRNGQPMEAAQTFLEVLQRDPDHINARFNLGIVYLYDLKDPARAIAQWEELLKRHPDARAGNGKPLKDIVAPLIAQARQADTRD